jgi:hypothetical protein
MQLDRGRPLDDAVRVLISPDTAKNSDFFKDCSYAFCIYKGMDARGGAPTVPKGLDDGLDGWRWQLYCLI